MLGSITGVLRGLIAFLMYLINTVFWCIPLFIIAFFKFLIPIDSFRVLCSNALVVISNCWIFCNNININLMNRIKWEVTGIDKLKLDEWYLVVSNHQTWVDIFVLQKIFFMKIPFLKFFLKKELIWVPLLGMAWWALDFPFMKRYSRAFLKKNPHLKGKDIETTRKACEKFRRIPISIMNFTEGTRFSSEKHSKQQSPYKNLLKPKAGGVAFVLAAMGDQLNRILNVTIAYPDNPPSFWDFLRGRLTRVRVKVDTLPITSEILGDYTNNPEFRDKFQRWMNKLWHEKEEILDAMIH